MAYILPDYIIDQNQYILPEQIIDIEGKVILPDLMYWIDQFIRKSKLNKKHYPNPINVNVNDIYFDYITLYIENGYFADDYVERGFSTLSFIELLFNENWNSDKFTYLYSEVTDRKLWPKNILRHAMLYPKEARYFIPDINGTYNVFRISQTDVSLLYDIHRFKTGSSPYIEGDYILSGYVEDGPPLFSNSYYFETGYIEDDYIAESNYLKSRYNFDNLTELGKLMYIYLDFMANKSIEKVNWNYPMSSGTNLLTTFYEAYIMELIFNYYSEKSYLEENN